MADNSWWDDLEKVVGTVGDVILDGAQAYDQIATEWGVKEPAAPAIPTLAAAAERKVLAEPWGPSGEPVTKYADNSGLLLAAGALVLFLLLWG